MEYRTDLEADDRSPRSEQRWILARISKIEDLSDAVLGAGLDAVQMSSGNLSGSLLFMEHRGITYSSGYIEGKVALTGPLSADRVTLGLGLQIGAGSRHWLEEVRTGSTGIFHASDEHAAIYQPGSLYATATLDMDDLEREAARMELVLDRRQLGGTGFHAREMPYRQFAALRRCFEALHAGSIPARLDVPEPGENLLRLMIKHYARMPRKTVVSRRSPSHTRIVMRAKDYIDSNLDRPFSVDQLADAAHTSRSTLCRAFISILDESPKKYVRTLRLNRIRRDIAARSTSECTIASISNKWGISELGRLSGWYRELFGELPSQTPRQPRRQRSLSKI